MVRMKTQTPTKVGLELELLVTDKDGKVVNKADEILKHPSNNGALVKESTYGVVEAVSKPFGTLPELEKDFRSDLLTLENIANSLGLIAVPISELSPERSLVRRTGSPRYQLNINVLGEEKANMSNSVLGTHIHVDKQSDVISQYNLMQSMDPMFVLLSTSPYLMGKNTLNDCRVNVYRNEIFENFPLQGQLIDYAKDMNHIEQLNETRHSQWIERTGKKDMAKEFYHLDDTCWGPIRIRENTVEVRSADANTLSNIMAMAALFKGVNDYVFKKGRGVRIQEEKESYGMNESDIIIPSYSNLKQMETEGIRYGLKSGNIRDYLSHLINIANDGLDESERKYLNPFKDMIRTQENIANVLHHYSRELGAVKGELLRPEYANQMTSRMGQIYQKDLYNAAAN